MFANGSPDNKVASSAYRRDYFWLCNPTRFPYPACADSGERPCCRNCARRFHDVTTILNLADPHPRLTAISIRSVFLHIRGHIFPRTADPSSLIGGSLRTTFVN